MTLIRAAPHCLCVDIIKKESDFRLCFFLSLSLSLNTLIQAACILFIIINLQYVRIYLPNKVGVWGFDIEENKNIWHLENRCWSAKSHKCHADKLMWYLEWLFETSNTQRIYTHTTFWKLLLLVVQNRVRNPLLDTSTFLSSTWLLGAADEAWRAAAGAASEQSQRPGLVPSSSQPLARTVKELCSACW